MPSPAQIKQSTGSAFQCSRAWRAGTRWSLTIPGVQDAVGWFALMEDGELDSVWGFGDYSLSADGESLTLEIDALNGDVKLQLDASGTGFNISESGILRYGLDVKDNKVVPTNWQPVASATGVAIVQGPSGEQDALLFSGKGQLYMSSAATLPADWTLDCSFKTPVPATGTWHTLLRGTDHHVLIEPTGTYMGYFDNIKGTRFTSAFDITTLTPGWHRLTVVASAKDGTEYWIDGVRTGTHAATTSDSIRYIGSLQAQQPWGYLHRLRIYDGAIAPFLVRGGSGRRLNGPSDMPAHARLGPITRWSWEPSGGRRSEVTLLQDGVLSVGESGRGTWALQADGTYLFDVGVDIFRVVQLDAGSFVAASASADSNGRGEVRGHLLARYYEDIGTHNLHLDETAPATAEEVLFKLWGAGGGGPYGAAGGFTAGIVGLGIAQAEALHVENGGPNAFVGSDGAYSPRAFCQGGGRAAIVYPQGGILTALLVAGGGGGGSALGLQAGAGGGLTGGDATSGCAGRLNLCSEGATGGSQSAGGQGGVALTAYGGHLTTGTDGSRDRGGSGVALNLHQGCPGGNGYYGGGQGGATSYHGAPGAGGSGFTDAKLVDAGLTLRGEGSTPPAANDPDRTSNGYDALAGVPGRLRGKIAVIYDAAEITRHRHVTATVQALRPGSAWTWTSAGEVGSLVLVSDSECSLFHRSDRQRGNFSVDYDGTVHIAFSRSAYELTMSDDFRMLTGATADGIVANATLYVSPSGASGDGALFDSPGTFTYTVPPGVTTVRALLWGAGGGGGNAGAGGLAYGELAVFGGERFTVEVGGAVGQTADGVLPGGGRSAIYALGTSSKSELLVAGGGGGGSPTAALLGGAGGGQSGQPALAGCASQDPASCVSVSAGGGSAAAGGVAGQVSGNGQAGTAGGRNQAGVGLAGDADAVRQGAAGGGGYYGGGSGGANAMLLAPGGGGSGYVDSNKVRNAVLRGGNYTQPAAAPAGFTLLGRSARPGQPGMVYVQAMCPAGFSDVHPEDPAPCLACPAGTYTPAGSVGECAAHACAAGTVDDDADSSTECVSCNATSYQDRRGALRCLPQPICPEGQGVVNTPSTTVRAMCSPCVAGVTFSELGDDVGDNRVCVSVTPCAPGTTETAAATVSSDRQCDACTGGLFLDNGRCRQPTTCVEGQAESVPPSATADRQCKACEEGTFSNAPNATKCTPFTNCTVNFTYQAVTPSRFTDRVCLPVTPCADNTYLVTPATLTSNNVCTKCTVCPEATTTPCSDNADAVCDKCDACTAGNYTQTPCEKGKQAVCAPCNTCADDEYMTQPCTISGPAKCAKLRTCSDDEFEVSMSTRCVCGYLFGACGRPLLFVELSPS